jgi:hypothetical protein
VFTRALHRSLASIIPQRANQAMCWILTENPLYVCNSLLFLGAFARKSPISFIMYCLGIVPSVSPSAHMSVSMKKFPMAGFPWQFVFRSFTKICRQNSILVTIWQEWRTLCTMIQARFSREPCSLQLYWQEYIGVAMGTKPWLLHSLISQMNNLNMPHILRHT